MVPETIPSVDASLIDIHRHAAKRELVLFLIHLRDKPSDKPSTPRVQHRNR